MSDSTENKTEPSREQLEARVVAMLLGEASPFEEEQLREQLKTDTALAKFCAEIGQTLPLLNEALDVGQAPKAKSPKMRLARKRRGKLRQLFRSENGLAKRKVLRMDFRKALAIAAAVCAVLLVAAGLLLPSLGKSKAGYNITAILAPASRLGESTEAEEELRSGITTVTGYARTEGMQAASEAALAAGATPEAKRNALFARGRVTAAMDFLDQKVVEGREDVLSIAESLEAASQAGGEPEGASSTSPQMFGTISGKKPDAGLAAGERWAEQAPVADQPESTRSGGVAHNRSGRELANLALPELKSDDLAESPGNYGYYALPNYQAAAARGGRARSLFESESVRGEEAGNPVSVERKNLATKIARPTAPPVARFDDRYAKSVDKSAPKPSDGVDLYWFKQEAESSGDAVTADGVMSYGLAAAATKGGTTTFSIDSLHSTSEAKPAPAEDYFGRSTMGGPTAAPMPQAGVKGIDNNGRDFNWQFESAYKAGIAPGANAAAGGQEVLNWDVSVTDEAAKRQWGATRGYSAGEHRKQPGPYGGVAGGMGMGGGGFGGLGGGGRADGFGEAFGEALPMGMAGVSR